MDYGRSMSHVLEIMASQLACPFKAAPQPLVVSAKSAIKGQWNIIFVKISNNINAIATAGGVFCADF